MKLKYLLFALLAAVAQPSLAAEPASGLGETAIEPAAAVSAVRRQELQRVADALNAEANYRLQIMGGVSAHGVRLGCRCAYIRRSPLRPRTSQR